MRSSCLCRSLPCCAARSVAQLVRISEMTQGMVTPPHVSAFAIEPMLVFFDGDCAMCHRSIRFLLRRSRVESFRFVPLQSLANTEWENAIRTQLGHDLQASIVVCESFESGTCDFSCAWIPVEFCGATTTVPICVVGFWICICCKNSQNWPEIVRAILPGYPAESTSLAFNRTAGHPQ